MNQINGSLRDLVQKIRSCRKCGEKGLINNPKPVFSPVYPCSWMLIGQAPGKVEEKTGLPFSGRAGRTLFKWLKEAGFSEEEFRQSTYMTSITKCYPGKNPKGGGDRSPSREELALCLPYLHEEIKLVSPKVILLVGKLALEVILKIKTLDEGVGRVLKKEGTLLIPLPHPSGANRWLNLEENRLKLKKALGLIKELADVRDR